MKKDSQITVRIGSDLKDKLEELAKSEDRSLAYVVERILRLHVEQQEMFKDVDERLKKPILGPMQSVHYRGYKRPGTKD